MAYKRPGVYVEESLLANNPDFFPTTNTAGFVGVASRGPTTPTFVDNWSTFARLYGGFTGSNQALAHAVFQFFNNGGRNAYIVRVVGTGNAAATLTLDDRQVTPADVLKVDAANGGAWGNTVYVEVTDALGAGRWNLTVRIGGTSDQYVVERWTDLSGDPDDPRYAPSLINSTLSGSSFIRVTDLFNHTTGTYDPEDHAPATTAAGGVALATGAEGSVPTTTASGDYYDGVVRMASVNDFVTLNLPEITNAALINAVIAWAESRGNFFLVIDCGDRTVSEIIDDVDNSDSDGYTASSYAAVYYPRLSVADPSNSVPGSTRMTAPGGAVIGQYMATDAVRGVHKAPAGLGTRLNGVVSTERKATDTELDSLNAAHINAIKLIPGTGYCIFGARTLKVTAIDKFVPVRRTLISLRMALTDATRFAAFEVNDEVLWGELEAICERILLELWQEGGLRGNSPEDAFYVKCDGDNNTQSTVNAGEVHIEVGVALQTPAEFIVLRIGQFEAGSTVTEEA